MHSADQSSGLDRREMSRRDCLSWLARAAISASAFHACAHAGEKKSEKGAVRIADLISLRSDHAIEVSKPDLILTRTADGVAAMSVYCTHRRHKLDVERDGSIVCPVHGSQFDLSGKPYSGPAGKPLSWYLTNIDEDGNINVDDSKTVKHGQWAPLPQWARPAKPTPTTNH